MEEEDSEKTEEENSEGGGFTMDKKKGAKTREEGRRQKVDAESVETVGRDSCFA